MKNHQSTNLWPFTVEVGHPWPHMPHIPRSQEVSTDQDEDQEEDEVDEVCEEFSFVGTPVSHMAANFAL